MVETPIPPGVNGPTQCGGIRDRRLTSIGVKKAWSVTEVSGCVLKALWIFRAAVEVGSGQNWCSVELDEGKGRLGGFSESNERDTEQTADESIAGLS